MGALQNYPWEGKNNLLIKLGQISCCFSLMTPWMIGWILFSTGLLNSVGNVCGSTSEANLLSLKAWTILKFAHIQFHCNFLEPHLHSCVILVLWNGYCNQELHTQWNHFLFLSTILSLNPAWCVYQFPPCVCFIFLHPAGINFDCFVRMQWIQDFLVFNKKRVK